MKETSKSIHRRLREPGFVSRYFKGRAIDIGGKPDPLSLYLELFPLLESVITWDKADGDAQFMQSIKDESFDCVYSSHCLEHLDDPMEGLTNWFRILKPGGYLVVTVPDEDLYEQGFDPPNYNKDHRHTFTIFKHASWSSKSLNVFELLMRLGPLADVVRIQLEDSGFRYSLPAYDQTRTPIAEAAVEFIVRKRLDVELQSGGRLPKASTQWESEAAQHLKQYELDQRAAAARYPDPFTGQST